MTVIQLDTLETYRFIYLYDTDFVKTGKSEPYFLLYGGCIYGPWQKANRNHATSPFICLSTGPFRPSQQ